MAMDDGSVNAAGAPAAVRIVCASPHARTRYTSIRALLTFYFYFPYSVETMDAKNFATFAVGDPDEF
jgi:hypothetical protein